MTFGERLIELRKENGFNTRNEFAEKLGIPGTTLRNYETNAREPGHIFLKQISELFNVSVDYLLCLTDNKEVLNNFRLRLSEQNVIEKYRFISSVSPDGASAVDTVLDREYAIAEKLREQKEQLEKVQRMNIEVSEELIPLRLWAYYGKIACAGTGFIFDDIPSDTVQAPDANADFIIGVNGDSMEPDYSDGEKLYIKKVERINPGEVGIFTINNECFLKEYGKDGLVSRNKKYDDIPGNEDVRLIGKVVGKVEE